MAQEPDLTETGTTPTEEDRNQHSGRDIPGGDGGVSDEDINAITDATSENHHKTGVDHSTDNYGENVQSGGVGGVQDSSDTGSDIAHIKE